MHISPPKGTIAPNGGATAPGSPGLRPRPCRFALGGPPCYLPSGRSVCKNHGELQPVGAKRKPAVGRWATACSCPWGNPEGERRGAKAPPGIQLQGRRPSLGVAKPPPRAPQGSRLSVGKCSESTYRRKWQNGGMAHFAILRVQKLKSAVAVHRSMKHSFRAQDTPNADAELTHQRAFRRAQRGRGHGRIQVEAAGELPQGCCPGGRVPDNGQSSAMQGKPKKRAGRLLQGLARVAEAASWGGKRGLRRHPPGRDDTTHVPMWCRVTWNQAV